jgi:hypothetical protein
MRLLKLLSPRITMRYQRSVDPVQGCQEQHSPQDLVPDISSPIAPVSQLVSWQRNRQLLQQGRGQRGTESGQVSPAVASADNPVQLVDSETLPFAERNFERIPTSIPPVSSQVEAWQA